MPLESRLFVKTSVIALVLTFVGGAALAISEAVGRPVEAVWAIEHAHLAFVGWFVNLVIGIALWLLPLARGRFPETKGRYPIWLPYAVYLCLNVGLLLRFASEPFLAQNHLAPIGLTISALLQVLAIALFAVVAWIRTRPPSNPAPGVR
jgi:hypothetical protein